MSIKERQIRCSDNLWHSVVVWFCLEAATRVGIWCGFLWLKKVEDVITILFAVIFGFHILRFHILQIALDSMAEMQEYIDSRFPKPVEPDYLTELHKQVFRD